MRRFAILCAAVAAVFVCASAQAADPTLTVVSETASTITFSYPATSGADGYRYYADGQPVSRTLNPAQLTVKFGKQFSSYAVKSLDVSETGTVGVYPAPVEPPPPPQPEFPDATNTGVPDGVTLTPYTGPSNITTAGAVIDGKSMGCIQISAKNVTIRNSRISCPGDDYYVVDVGSSGSVTVQDSNIDCEKTNSNGAGRMYITLLRVEIQGCENGLSVAHDVTVQDSFIHDLYSGGGAHDDGMQFEGAAGNVNILHNTIYGVNAQGDQGTSAFIADLTGHHDWLIANNLFSGGAYTVYCVKGKGTNWVIRDNAFSLKYGENGTSGLFGFSTECDDDTQSGNYVYETGQPLDLG